MESLCPCDAIVLSLFRGPQIYLWNLVLRFAKFKELGFFGIHFNLLSPELSVLLLRNSLG